MEGLTQGSPLWLACRAQFAITGSRVPCLVGCHYESLNAFWEKKVFGKERKRNAFSLQCMAWGSERERQAYEYFVGDIEKSSCSDGLCEDLNWRYSNGLHVWAEDPAVAASPDAVGYLKKTGDPCICLEIKCPYAGSWHLEKEPAEMFRKKPQHWIQLQMNMACCGTDYGAFYVWSGVPTDADMPPFRKLVLCVADEEFVEYMHTKIVWFKELLEEAKQSEMPKKQLRVPSGWKAEALDLIEESVKRSVFSEEQFSAPLHEE